MAALLKEAFSGLVVEMDEEFGGLGALLKAKKTTPNAMITLPHFPTPSRMTMPAGQKKNPRNRLDRKKTIKTDNGVVLSKGNSDILN